MKDQKDCELLEAWHDQWLDDEASAAFRRHLAVCAECREELAFLQALDRDLVTAWQHVAVPEPSGPAPVRRASRFGGRRFGLRTPGGTMAAATAVAVLLAASTWLVLLAGRGGSKDPEVPPVARQAADDQPQKLTNQAGAGRLSDPADGSDGLMAMPLARTKQLTVYRVVPKTTCFNPE